MKNLRLDKDNLVIFSDFDGTVATRDVGNRLFYHFSDGRSEEPVARWRADKIDSRQCLAEEAATMRDVTIEELNEFIDGFEIDESFTEFVGFTENAGIPLYILSDGFDLYIKRLLEKNGLGHLPVFANQAEVVDGRLQANWPYYDKSCGKCANCKGHHIRTICNNGRTAVYIGDGKSDLCAIPEADLIFARDFLAAYCYQNKIDYRPFKRFSDITGVLKESLRK